MYQYTPGNTWHSTISNFDTTDVVQGGASGTDNVPLKELADNNNYLYDINKRYEGITQKTVSSGSTAHTLTRANYLRKLIWVYFNANLNATLTLPNISTTTIGDIIDIGAYSAANVYNLVAISGDVQIIDATGLKTTIWLYHGERVRLVNLNGSNWVILSFQGNHYQVGDQMFGYVAKQGMLLRQGGVYNRASFPRLWDFISSNASALLVSDSTWLTGVNGKFSDGDGSTTFRLPDDRGYFDRALDLGRNVDADRFSSGDGSNVGHIQADELKSHRHFDNTVLGTGGSGKVIEGNTGIGGGVYTGYTGGSETRPKNVGKLPLIIY